MNDQINYVAVRAFRKVWEPIAAEHELAAEMDAGFDAGEWSGPAHANLECAAYEACLHRVAAKFNLSATVLGNQLCEAEYNECERFRSSL